VLVGVGFLTVALTNSAASERLRFAQSMNDSLVAEQRSYSEVSSILSEISGAQTQLEVLLADDVSPAALAKALREAAPGGVAVTSLTLSAPGASADGGITGAASGNLDDSGLVQLGRIDITGTAPDQATIADYLDNLAGLSGVTVPYVVSVRTVENTTQFTAQATITSDARTLRFAPEEAE
jgi:Tfp pilus assembly protein PilN